MQVEKHLNWSHKNPAEFLLRLAFAPIREAVCNRIALLIKEHSYKEILEIGFGAGREYARLKSFLKEQNCNYTGLDITQSFVQHAKSVFTEANWIQGDCRDMNFKNKQFDLTFMFHLLEHSKNYKDLQKSIYEICRVTKSHVLIVWFLNPIFKPSHREVMNHRAGFYYYWTWNYYQLIELFETCNFRLNSIFWCDPHKNKCWVLEEY